MSGSGALTINEQAERMKVFGEQVEKAASEGLVLGLGDLNIDLNNIDSPNYYLRKVSDEYLSVLANSGMELFNYGITWRRIHKDGKELASALDHAFCNKPVYATNREKIECNFSDHDAISVELQIGIPKRHEVIIKARDVRKLRSNPKYFRKVLSNIDWAKFTQMQTVEEMTEFFTSEIIKALDKVAPFKTKKIRSKKKHPLPAEIMSELKKRQRKMFSDQTREMIQSFSNIKSLEITATT